MRTFSVLLGRFLASRDKLPEPEDFTALRLRGLNPPRLAFLDDIRDEQVCVARSRVKRGMWFCTFRERLTGSIGALDAVLVVKVNAPLSNCDQEETWVAMPTGVTTRSDNEILHIKLRLALVLQIEVPIVTDSDFLLERNDSGALSEYHVGDDASRRRC